MLIVDWRLGSNKKIKIILRGAAESAELIIILPDREIAIG